MKSLTSANLQTLFTAAISRLTANTADFYRWINRPTFQSDDQWHDGEWPTASSIEPAVASANFEAKINGAYGERFLASLGLIASLVANGYRVRLVQFQKEPGVPFNAEGWLVMIIETMPIFHIAPWDLPLADVAEIVELLPDNTAADVSWKNTNKVGEFTALLRGSLQPGLDLVTIAQEGSK